MNGWSVYCDDNLIYQNDIEDYEIYSPKLVQEVNKCSSFTFTIYSNHPNYGLLQRLKSIIEVYKDDLLCFRGRILNDTVGFYNQKEIVCEGELAYLNDSVIRPFTFPTTDEQASPADYFSYLITQHNSQVSTDKQFQIGNVTVTDPNNYISRSDIEYSTTWELLNSGLIDTHGGYIVLRRENGVNYLDYLSDFNQLSTQPIVFGQNLIDLKTEVKGEDVATAILPLGKQGEDTGNRLTISSIADYTSEDICKSGDIIYSIEAEEKYGGRITKVVTWDDVTVADNLYSKAVSKLSEIRQITSTLTLTAVDLKEAGYDVEPYMVGRYVYITDEQHKDYHDLQSYYIVKSLTINLFNPESNNIVVGETTTSFTEKSEKMIQTYIGTLIINDSRQEEAIAETKKLAGELSSEIKVTNQNVTQNYKYTETVASDLKTVSGTVDNIDTRVTTMEGYIQTGVIGTDSYGNQIVGIKIGQKDLTNFFKAIFTAQELGFYEGDTKTGFFAQKKLNVETIRTAQFELTDDLSDTNKTDFGISLVDGFTIKWMGNS